MRAQALALVPFLATVACDDYVLGLPAEGDLPEPGPGYTCDWNGVQAFFHARCDACHTRDDEGNPRSGGFVLVEVIEEELATGEHYLVVPGDPEASLMWQSLTNSSSALLMPYGFTEPLEMAEIEHVACWIADGAPL